MKGTLRTLFISMLVLLLPAWASVARAQYIYMDANGNGIHDSGDVLNAIGATTVTIYVNTNTNRDGTTAVCDFDGVTPLDINSYGYVVQAVNGTVVYGTPTNLRTEFTIHALPLNNQDGVYLSDGWGAGTYNTPGLWALSRFTVTIVSGTPSLKFNGSNPNDAAALTLFGTECLGHDFDGSYKLSPTPFAGNGLGDFFDSDGVAAPAGVDQAPTVSAPGSQSVNEGAPLSFTVTASDPDGDAITSLTAAPLPSGAAFTPNGANTSGTFNWTPTFTQAGTYSVTFTAANALTGTAATQITVVDVNRPPVVVAPASETVDENAPLSFTVTASDPDGDAIINLTAAPLPSGATFTKNAPSTAGTFSWTPDFTQAGTYDITFTATNALTGTTATLITVNNVDRAPAVSAPAAASGPENSALSFTVTASDPDGDAITNLTAAPLPSGATFTKNGANMAGTFSWTPATGQAGTYNVTFTASNALTGTATTGIAITGGDHPPVVTAPAAETGAENSPLSFTVTASDPDGNAIANLTAAPLPTGASFTPNGANTSGTFSWTPSFTQAGTYSVTFTATNALTGTATTLITIANTDRAPVVTAPAAMTGFEGSLFSFTVSASDADGDAITSLTAAPLPAGATFTPNGSNTTGSFSWTPGFDQAGPYSVTFTAANALTGTATTNITIENTDRPPVVTAPANEAGSVGVPLSFSVTASDPDGDAITNLTAAPLPSGATFTKNGTNTAGTFSWTPAIGQDGTYNVTFTASNALSGTATTHITITAAPDRAPVVSAPASETGTEGVDLNFTVTASDPDGDAITALTAAPLPSGATFTPNGAHTSGTFDWTPSFTQAGTYSVTFTAANALTGSAATLITINNVDRAPAVTAPATQGGPENALLSFTVTASDPDGDAITSLTAAPLPSGATFTPNGSNTSGTFGWTPATGQSGTYDVTFTASNALTGTASTLITIGPDQAPVVTAPAAATVNEGVNLSFTVTASDPDGNAITSLTAAPLPSGATFTPNGSNTSGTFNWMPSFTQAGTYSVTFTAANALTGTAATAITVNDVDRAPVVTAPATVNGTEGVPINFTVTASDADGDAITSLTAAPLPSGATFTPNGSNTSGTFDWTPGAGQSGTYTVIFTASNALTGTAATTIHVGHVNVPPVVTAPATETVKEGVDLNFAVTASDPDGDPITSLTAAPLPAGATFTKNGTNTAGTFDWTPGFDQAGTYSVTFSASDGNGGTGAASTAITVSNVNRAPVANAGGPYTGVVNVAVSFNGTGSSDPDGDALTYGWDFGDGATGSGATTSHIYTSTAGSPYTVVLTVSDGFLSGTDQTTATISDVFPATAFLTGGNKTTRLGSGKPFTCVQIQPDNGSFDVTNVVLSTIKMVSVGTGSVSEIFAANGKTAIDGDKNGDGIVEIQACFSKDDLRLLFSGLSSGPNTVNVTIQGDLSTGGSFAAPLTMDVVVSGKGLAAVVSPNPFNPETAIDFTTQKLGPVRLHIFDLTGRLVATLVNEAMPAGYHSVRWDGRTSDGGKVASGIYYFRLEADGQKITQRLTVLK